MTPQNVLIAGERRLAACKALGWTDVPVRVVDLGEIVRGEFAENADRKDFLPTEIDAIRRAMLPVEKAAAKERQGARTDLQPSGSFREVQAAKPATRSAPLPASPAARWRRSRKSLMPAEFGVGGLGAAPA